MIELDNARWGFESNCFVCEPRNDRGLGIRFSHDPARDVVTATFDLGDAFSGAPTWVHGGSCSPYASFAELKRDRLAHPALESVRRWQQARDDEAVKKAS